MTNNLFRKAGVLVIVSAFADQAPKDGVRAVLRKPVQVTQLLGALEAAIA